MPKKKGKKSKKKSKSDELPAPDLDIEGDGTQLGITKKKKGKKAKLSKEEKAAAKLAKKLEEFINNPKLYDIFLQKVDRWMIRNRSRVETLFKRFDADQEGIVPYQVFRAGLHDLLCPLTELEIYALCKKLDPEGSGMVEYYGFDRGIHNRVIDEQEDNSKLLPDDYSPELYETKQPMKPGLNDPFHQDYPRYVTLNMRLSTFESIGKHPGHLLSTVRSSMPVSVLVEVIKEESKIVSGELRVYSDKSCQAENRLPLAYTLEQCGIVGGPMRDPPTVTLYYDYAVEFSDCPLLNCDHYFGIEKRPLNPVLFAYPDATKK